MSAAPHLTNGAPDGTEAIANIQTLSRTYYNAAGEAFRADDYFNLTGVTYSTALYIGTVNTNYYTTLYGYDVNGNLASSSSTRAATGSATFMTRIIG